METSIVINKFLNITINRKNKEDFDFVVLKKILDCLKNLRLFG